MGKVIKFIISLLLIIILAGIVYAYINIDEVIEYRDNKNINQDEIVVNIINEEKINNIENKVENEVKIKVVNKVENKTSVVFENIIENKNLENVVENVMENTINN